MSNNTVELAISDIELQKRLGYIQRLKPLTLTRFYKSYESNVPYTRNVVVSVIYKAVNRILNECDINKLYMDRYEDFICLVNDEYEIELLLNIPHFGLDECEIPQGVVRVSNMFEGIFMYSPFVDKVVNETTTFTDATNLFRNFCNNSLDIRYFRTDLLNNVTGMFRDMKYLRNLEISKRNFNLCNVEHADYMFAGTIGLVSITVPFGLVLNKLKTATHMFDGCSTLVNVYMDTNIVVENLKDVSYMFNNCAYLSAVHLTSDLVLSNECNTNHMFNNCLRLEKVSVDGENYIQQLTIADVSNRNKEICNTPLFQTIESTFGLKVS